MSSHVASSSTRSSKSIQSVPSSTRSRYSASHDGQAESSSQAASSSRTSVQINGRKYRDDITPEPTDEAARDGGHLHVLRNRVRRSGGGFLLDHSLGGQRKAAERQVDADGKRREDAGKRREDAGTSTGTGTIQSNANGGRMRSSSNSNRLSSPTSARSSPLSQEMRYAHFDKVTTASASGPVPLRPETRHSEPAPTSHPSLSSSSSSLEPSQLVQMALSLSEGRRRHASTGLSVPSATADTRRIRSAGGPTAAQQARQQTTHGHVLHVGAGSPLANDFLRPSAVSNHMAAHDVPRSASMDSEGRLMPLPSGSHRGSYDDQDPDMAAVTDVHLEENVEFEFSAGTLSRAERAKKFFELSSEYRRLLTHLPPLKPDASAPGNYTFATSSAPGNVQPQINRVRSYTNSRHELGREYNPLQLIRNRRVRHREQRPLDPASDAFDHHVDKVKTYVDDVDKESQHGAYRRGLNVVSLPVFRPASSSEDTPPAQTTTATTTTTTTTSTTTRTHKRTDTAVSKSFRPIGDWSFTPAELFADALWLEQRDNKALIENRHGNKTFPHLHSDRVSTESTRSGRKSRDSSRPRLERSNTRDSNLAAIDDPASTTKRGRKTRKLLSLRSVDSAARRHIFRQRDRSNSSSDDHSADRRNLAYNHSSKLGEENVGPLDRHMRTLIERERETSDVDSPDRWDRLEAQRTGSIAEDVSFDGDDKVHTAAPLRRLLLYASDGLKQNDSQSRTQTQNQGQDQNPQKIDDNDNNNDALYDPGRPSFDESTAPNSPAIINFIPSFGMSLSPPVSRNASPERRHGMPKTSAMDTNKIQEMDFAASQSSLSQQRSTKDDDALPANSTLDCPRPSPLKRHKTTNSIDSERPSHDRRGSKDTPMSRFFKGGRIGDLVRSEGSTFGDVIWKKKPPKDVRDASDAYSGHETATSDEEQHEEEDAGPDAGMRPSLYLSRTSTTASAIKSKFHTPGLPTFKSQKDVDDEEQQQQQQQQDPLTGPKDMSRVNSSRSARFDRLAPPRIQLPDDTGDVRVKSRKHSAVSSASDRGRPNGGGGGDSLRLPKNRSASSSESDVSEVVTPGSTSSRTKKGYLSSSAKVSPNASRRPSLQGKRHWSISDPRKLQQIQEAERQHVTQQDLARVRALFLSSGVKAHQLLNRAHSLTEPPSPFLVSAARISGQEITPVPAREEYTLAAKFLSSTISAKTTVHRSALDSFRSDRAPALHARFQDLRYAVDENLMPRIQSTADEADAFTVEVTTQQTLAVKQVNDAVDNILRARRRRLRLLRRMGFKLLEWAVVVLLWVVWFVVLLIRSLRGLVLGVVRGVRWCLWL